MVNAAVPSYLGTDFSTASPGQRFGVYLPVWDSEFRVTPSGKNDALKFACRINPNDSQIMHALRLRQQYLHAAAVGDTDGLLVDARAVAPFTTGLGNEHPLENGFAFLDPYGLPYLPGSGVKGVLRQAATELASGEWGATHGWDADLIGLLFGFGDTDDTAQRGALVFWDVIPQIAGNLRVEIMTPHQAHYYQGDESPHDCGKITPIKFLTVPPGSEFTFHVQIRHSMLQHSPDLLENDKWKSLVMAAFEHAFIWLGFGAKTAVGYGAMKEDPQKRAAREEFLKKKQEAEREARERAERERQIASMGPVERAIAECLDARVDKNQPEINALIAALKAGKWADEIAVGVAKTLKERLIAEDKWREFSNKKKPEKDTVYQNTLFIKTLLNE